MFRFITLILCVSLVLALPPKKEHSKITPLHLKDPKIINGQQATLGQFPWQVALYITGEDDDDLWFCGGSIINEEWILTAGHCVIGATSGQVVSGTITYNSGYVSQISQFILHDNYDEEFLGNDIGLVKLSSPLTFDDNTAAIALASETLEAGVLVTISGWGVTSDNATSISSTLNYVQLVTISTSECLEAYFPEPIYDEQICAVSDTDEVKSTCSGDSGGPVVVNADSDAVHVALVSFISDAGCESGYPSGYIRTAYYLDWIKETTGI